MAFGFIKKVFSFGKKEVEERLAEDAPLKPLNFEALDALKAERQAEPQAPAPTEIETPAEAESQAEKETAKASEQQPPAVEEASPPAPPEPEVDAAPAVPESPREAVAPQLRKPVEEPVLPAIRPTETTVPKEAATPKVTEPTPEPSIPEPEPDLPKPPVEPPLAEPQPELPEPLLEPDIPEPAPDRAAPSRSPLEIPGPTVPEAAPEVFQPKEPVKLPPQELRSADARALGPSSRLPSKEGEGIPPKPSSGRVTVAKKVEQKAEPEPAPPAPAPRPSWFQRMRAGLSRSSRELSGNIAGIFTKRKLDEDALQDLEDVLIRADLGVEAAMRITDALASGRYGKDVSDIEVRRVMATEVEKVLSPVALPLELDLSYKPHVILVVGVNGTGKTTTIGKLAAKLTEGGLSVMLAAGDTFRAAAIEQLKIWGERTSAPVISSKLGADAAGLAFDAFQQAKEAGSDVLIIDTAGRLQNKAELMAELEKIVRVLGRLDPEAPHTVLQTVDATTGQNALNQVDVFRNVAGVNGLVLTKLDGTARGGILVAIAAKHRLPVYFIGVGEQVDDLEPFSAREFAEAIAGTGPAT
jgi:fused signal recognition particle receptor